MEIKDISIKQLRGIRRVLFKWDKIVALSMKKNSSLGHCKKFKKKHRVTDTKS